MAPCEYGGICPIQALLFLRADCRIEQSDLYQTAYEGPDNLGFVELLLSLAATYPPDVKAVDTELRRMKPC
jgi:hypothetical protein